MADWTDMLGPPPNPEDPTAAPYAVPDVGPFPPPHWGYGAPPPALPDEIQPGLGVPAAALEQAQAAQAQAAPAAPAITMEPPSAPTTDAPHPLELGAPAQDASGIAFPPAHWGASEQPAPGQPEQPNHDELQIEEPDYVGNPLENPDQAAGVDQLVGMSGEEFARVAAKHEAARTELLHARMLEEAQRTREQVELHEKARVEGTKRAEAAAKQLEADAAQLANERLDSNRFWSSRNTGQKIAGFIAAIAGGIMQSKRGGPNEGLAFIEREIDRDIGEQQFNLNARRAELGRRQTAVGQMFERTNDEYRAAETARVAAWGTVINQLQAEAQNYDPRGTTALQIADAVRQARARQLEALAKYTAEEQKRMIEAQKAQLEADKFKETARHNKADEKNTSWRIAVDKKLGESRLKYDAFKADRDYELDKQKVGLQARELEQKGQLAEAQKFQQFAIPGVKDKDGNVFVAKAAAPDEAKAIRSQVAATRTLVRMLDEARRIRSGWTSDTAKSPEWQQLKANWGLATGAAKNLFQLGALSGPDMELVGRIIGSEDPTEARSIGAGLEKARENLINYTNDSLKSVGLDTKFEITDHVKDAPPPQDEDYKRAIEKPDITSVIELYRKDHPGERVVGKGGSELYSSYVLPGRDASIDNVVLPDVRKYIDKLEQLRNNPKTNAEAVTALDHIVRSDTNQGTKDYAMTALTAPFPEGSTEPEAEE